MNEIYINKADIQNKATIKVFDDLFPNQDLIPIDDIIEALENAHWHEEDLQDEIRHLENDMENNYKYIGDNDLYY